MPGSIPRIPMWDFWWAKRKCIWLFFEQPDCHWQTSSSTIRRWYNGSAWGVGKIDYSPRPILKQQQKLRFHKPTFVPEDENRARIMQNFHCGRSYERDSVLVSKLSGPLVTTAWRIFRLRMEVMVCRQGWFGLIYWISRRRQRTISDPAAWRLGAGPKRILTVKKILFLQNVTYELELGRVLATN
jgi:hypothetical protein